MGSLIGVISEARPQYTVLFKSLKNNFEIRKYETNIAIQISSENNKNLFRALANYIGVISTPANERKEVISMTAPVLMFD